mgnify:FL=1
MPGKLALAICPDILKKLKLPKLTIAVTGSNGKTSTTELINHIAKTTGKKVISNSKGSNQIEGVATLLLRNSNFKGEVMADIAVIESDERFCQYTFSQFAPDYILVTNLFRDQLTRNGHSEYVHGELKKGLPKESKLILNADDPLTASLGIGRKDAVYFSIKPTAFIECDDKSHAYDDGCCPVCGKKLKYTYRIYNHLGEYKCEFCGCSAPDAYHSITGIIGDRFEINKKHLIKPQIVNTIFANNLIAAFAAGAVALSLPEEDVAKSLDGYVMKNDRIVKFELAGREGTMMITKHENSLAYGGVLNTIVDEGSEEKTVAIIFDLLSRRYIANDVSWLWDIDFEVLRDDSISKIFLGGKFAYDLRLRLDFAGIDKEKIVVVPDIGEMVEKMKAESIGRVFAMTCFTDVDKFIQAV